MSRAGVYRTIATVAVVASLVSLVSCRQKNQLAGAQQAQALLDAIAPDVETVHINIACATVDSISMTDNSGQPAWNVVRHPGNSQKDMITWVVGPSVTINSIKGESDSLPLDVDPNQNGGQPGNAFKAKVKGNAAAKNYAYELAMTCTAGPDTTHLVIDPELILRKP
jgi:hypothetical protein